MQVHCSSTALSVQLPISSTSPTICVCGGPSHHEFSNAYNSALESSGTPPVVLFQAALPATERPLKFASFTACYKKLEQALLL